jgi:hypothetical protein
VKRLVGIVSKSAYKVYCPYRPLSSMLSSSSAN